MKPKKIITAVLLGFIFVSIAFLTARETGLIKDSGQTPNSLNNDTADVIPAGGEQFIAYYFCGNVRCMTCHKLETYTKECLTLSFSDEISSGRLLLKTVNTDIEANRHFIDEFALTSKAVVLTHMKDGKQISWKNLDRIWDLVGDEDEFKKYIADETKLFLTKETE